MAFKAIFLDRDNTIIDDPGYINHPNQVTLLPGAAGALSDMRSMGYKLIIISNQSGVARGIVTEDILSEIHEKLYQLLRKEGVFIDGIYYCPFHPEGVIEKYRKESHLRKPQPGMLLLAAEEMDINLAHSWMIGDSYRDIEAGKRAGCRTILINSPTNPTIKDYSDPEADSIAVNIREAANIIKMCVRDGKLPFKVAEKRKVPNAPPLPNINEDVSQSMTTQQSQMETETELEQPEIEMQPKQQKNTPQNHQDNYDDQNAYYPEDDDNITDENYDNDNSITANETNNQLLKQIADSLRKNRKDDQYDDFSLLKVFAGIVQIAVIFCMIISIWFVLDQTKEVSSVHTMIGYAIVLQLMAIAFYIMNWRK